jgi:hypothetical protein
MFQRQFLRLAVGAVLAASLAGAHAVELGDTLVRSHIGQGLSADIELTGIENEAAVVQAALADPEVYRGANIAMHPALASLNITIVRRDGRRFVHLASAKAVESEFVNVFLALSENGRPSVRQATLWFTPDPHPAPPPEAPPPVKPVPAVAPAAVVRMPAPAPAIVPLPRPQPPAACVQQFSAAQIGTCTALDAKNAALNAHIAELEAKVGRLSAAVQGSAPTPPAVKAVPAKLTPMGAPQAAAPKPGGATPWLFIGIASAAVLSVAGALFYVLMRKRKAIRTRPAAKTGAGFIASVKNRLLPGRKDAAPAAG